MNHFSSGMRPSIINTNPAVDVRAVKRINKELERIQRYGCQDVCCAQQQDQKPI
jgi:hypothetical protein